MGVEEEEEEEKEGKLSLTDARDLILLLCCAYAHTCLVRMTETPEEVTHILDSEMEALLLFIRSE